MADVWRDAVLKTLKETESKNREGAGYGRWVIMKIKNDNCHIVSVRSGSYYTDKVTGEKRYPKEGLTGWDFDALKKEWEGIKHLLDQRNPPEVPTNEPEPQQEEPETPPDKNPIEGVPW